MRAVMILVKQLLAEAPAGVMYSLFYVGVLVALYFARLHFSKPSHEPPVAKTVIPGIGHIIGLMMYGAEYFTKLSETNTAGVMTLPMMGTKVYVVTSPEAVQAAYKNQKLDLVSLALAFLHKIGGGAKPWVDQLLGEAKVDANDNYWHDMNKVVRDQLASGPGLRQMNSRVLDAFAGVLAGLEDGSANFPNFYTFVWRTLVHAKTDALYGERNPFRDEALVDQYWNFEKAHLDLMFRPFPSISARSTLIGRNKVLKAFDEYSKYYLEHPMQEDVSRLIQARSEVNQNWNLDVSAVSATELSLLYGSTANAIPTLYWMITYVFHDTELLAQLRTEVRPLVEAGEAGEMVVDTTRFAAECPLLNSTYQETLRMVSRHPGARIVEEDTVIEFKTPASAVSASSGEKKDDGKTSYLLTKGSVVQMPAGLLHKAEETWGPDAKEFRGRRFLDLHADRKAEIATKKAYIPLGGGKHLCPGRHFSFTEILGTMTMLMLGYELGHVDGGAVKVPEQFHPFGLGIVKPNEKDDLRVKIAPRVGWEGKTWSFKV